MQDGQSLILETRADFGRGLGCKGQSRLLVVARLYSDVGRRGEKVGRGKAGLIDSRSDNTPELRNLLRPFLRATSLLITCRGSGNKQVIRSPVVLQARGASILRRQHHFSLARAEVAFPD